MCRPPDLTPAAAVAEGLAVAFDDEYIDDEAGWEPAAPLTNNVSPVQVSPASLLGKRPLGDANLAALASCLNPKVPRVGTQVSSAFDSAAASFMARMEQSLLHEMKRKQEIEQVRAHGTAQQQLQQLLLLSNLQGSAVRAPAPAVPNQQQQLLLAQQRLLQQSQSKLLSSLSPLVPMATAPLTALGSAPLPADVKVQAMLKAPPLAPILPAPGPMGSLGFACAFPLVGGLDAGPSSLAYPLDDDKKVKRMQSNRASAKRSRQRKQARLEELDKSTQALEEENVHLTTKLDEAQEQIQELQGLNQALSGEVASLRKMLGLEASGSCKTESGAASASAVANPQSSVEWSDAASKGKRLAAATSVGLTEEVIKEEWALPEGQTVDCTSSPRSGLTFSPSFEFLAQGEEFSELLACLEA